MLVFFVLIGLLVAPSEFIASHGLNGFTEALSEKDTNYIHACSITLRSRSPPPNPGQRRRDITAAHRACRKMPANRCSNVSAPTISMSPHVFRSRTTRPIFSASIRIAAGLRPHMGAPAKTRQYDTLRWRIAFGLSWLWDRAMVILMDRPVR